MKKLPSGGGNGALTTAWITATGETDTTIISALNTLETDLTTYGLTAKIKALYPMVGGTAAKHKFNFLDARDLDAAYRLVFSGGITHSSTGMLFNGTNGTANTKLFNASVLGLNSTHVSLYNRTNNTTSCIDISNTGSSFNFTPEMYISFGGTAYFTVNQGTNSTITNSNAIGLHLITRINSTTEKLFKAGSLLLSSARPSSGQANGSITISGRGGSFWSNREYAFASIGDGLTDGEATNLYTAVQAFQTTLSRQV
jgi:hypothetical protein